MRLEHYNLEKLKKEILEIIGRNLDLSEYKLFFFGSRVLGKGNDRSDIDIGIEGPAVIPWQTMSAIKEAVFNLPTLYKIDIIDFKDVDEKFYQVATEKREFLN